IRPEPWQDIRPRVAAAGGAFGLAVGMLEGDAKVEIPCRRERQQPVGDLCPTPFVGRDPLRDERMATLGRERVRIRPGDDGPAVMDARVEQFEEVLDVQTHQATPCSFFNWSILALASARFAGGGFLSPSVLRYASCSAVGARCAMAASRAWACRRARSSGVCL